ncbi:hypothetical protein GJAV_G00070800 [Gymnothorax javanicus]|nr:hypothetical protein GJAV_G00070800 [Gymnothorax javanicus]
MVFHSRHIPAQSRKPTADCVTLAVCLAGPSPLSPPPRPEDLTCCFRAKIQRDKTLAKGSVSMEVAGHRAIGRPSPPLLFLTNVRNVTKLSSVNASGGEAVLQKHCRRGWAL